MFFYFCKIVLIFLICSKDVNFEELSRCTEDFNGAQCKAVCVEAVSIRNSSINLTSPSAIFFTKSNFWGNYSVEFSRYNVGEKFSGYNFVQNFLGILLAGNFSLCNLCEKHSLGVNFQSII